MQLLLERSQSHARFGLVPLRVGGGVMFTLWAKAELTEEEAALVRRYSFEDALLVAADPIAVLKQSIRTSAILGVVLLLALWMLIGFLWAIYIALLGFVILTAIYYNELREHIYVRDLIHGRRFRCFSIVALVQKEAYVTNICSYLRQVLETAKHWSGQEAVEVPQLDPAEAKQLVAREA